MKTLKEAIESQVKSMIERRDQLDRHAKEYASEGNYYSAMLSKIKKEQFDLIISRLEAILSNY